MAKGNLFLGTAARSVGDVVMYRREGSQVSRVRVRKIANPKTEAQCRQRAYMAPIPKFFSPLAVVLERSFEGLSKSKSYSKFLKVNADKARTNDWLLPKGIGFFPLPYQLSQGTLPSLNYKYDGQFSGFNLIGLTLAETPTTVGDLSSALISYGYKKGDIFTCIINTFKNPNPGQTVNPLSVSYIPHVGQFEIDDTSEVLLSVAMPGFVFAVNGNVLNIQVGSDNVAGGAAIVARFENEKWRRSTQSMILSTDILQTMETATFKAAAIASYSNSVSEPNPMVYLDGDELDNA